MYWMGLLFRLFQVHLIVSIACPLLFCLEAEEGFTSQSKSELRHIRCKEKCLIAVLL